MCVACVEFIKGTLTLKEFGSALQEVSRTGQTDEPHLSQVEEALRKAKLEPEAARKLLRGLQASPRD